MKYLAFWIAVMALIGGAVAIASGTGDEGRNIQAWATKYRDAGLVVVGLHWPEFGFEKSERVIRELLVENGATGLSGELVRVAATGAEAPPSELRFRRRRGKWSSGFIPAMCTWCWVRRRAAARFVSG